ncbi:MAG TPA: DUF1320 domain-containing protein [Ignavibacteria bacterium]|nr:DUF1320 domain-containing protein [Ignavibacteria bacterium]
MYIDKNYFLTRISPEKLNELTDGDDNKLIQVISTADAIVDSYLRTKINVLPLSNPDANIKDCSYNIAIYKLHESIQYESIPEYIMNGYDIAINYLKDVASGKVQLTVLDEIPDENIETSITKFGYKPKYDRDKLL